MNGYLFAYFTGEEKDGEQIYFAVSEDGLFWEDLNGKKPVLYADKGAKGVRDPFLVTSPKRDRFYLIATDLCIGREEDWEKAQYRGSKSIAVWESEDLVRWSEQRLIPAGDPGWGCVWAPEAIYDREKEAFFVYWSSMTREEGREWKQKIYGAYTRDFTSFTQRELYLEKEHHVIDMTVIQEGGNYYRFLKDETRKRLFMEVGESLQDQRFRQISSRVLSDLYGVEGPQIYPLGEGRWCLIADRFASKQGYVPMVTENLNSGEFRILEKQEYSFGECRKRHGGVLPVTGEELCRLRETYGEKRQRSQGGLCCLKKGVTGQPGKHNRC